MTGPSYPVHLQASLDTPLSRGLWLVKWLLVIPHYFVLAFLWLAFAVLSVIAFFAILITGRYPRAIFEFNVGVLRWSWRVSFYAYGALGTDRYPPFTLDEVADYPAHLTIDYPERLSRGLVLVKWWLLAIPHYLVVALMVGGGWYVGDAANDNPPVMWGLIGLLVTVAAVVLLFTGRYPQPIFDLVLGLNRWAIRVAAYATLMTDEYPPFRLDMGGGDPGSRDTALRENPAPGASGTSLEKPSGESTGARTGWTGERVTALVIGSIFALIAAGLVVGGGVLAVADQTQRDSDGYLMSDTVSLQSAGYAVASHSVDLTDNGQPNDVPGRMLGDPKVVVTPVGAAPVFVGLARTSEVDAYLSGVRHTTVLGFERQDPEYRQVGGGAPQTAPADTDIWAESVSGPGRQTLTWPVESGDWTLVVMNREATAPVAADVAVGGTVPGLGWIVGGLFVAGGVLLLLALGLILGSVLSVRRPGEPR